MPRTYTNAIFSVTREGETHLENPDPFVVVTVDGEQTQTTIAAKKTLSPSWYESFDV
jgi:Ca2+-dependent lipid-binding protein